MRAYETLADEYPSSRHAEKRSTRASRSPSRAATRSDCSRPGRAYVGAFPDSARAWVVKAAIKQRAPERAASLPSPPPPGLASLYDLRFWTGDSATRVVIDVERKVRIESDRISNPDRLWIDLFGTRLHPKLEQRHFVVGDGLLQTIRLAHNRDNVVRVVLDFAAGRQLQRLLPRGPAAPGGGRQGPAPTPDGDGASRRRGRRRPGPMPATRRPRPLPGPATKPRPTVVEVVPDADDDVGVDDPGATAAKPPSRRLPAVAAATPSSAPASSAPLRLRRSRWRRPRRPWLSRRRNLRPRPPRRPIACPRGASTPWPPRSRRAPARPKPAPVTLEGPPPTAPRGPGHPAPAGPGRAPPSAAPTPPQANRAGSYSLARQLGLGARRIVIDAGHGGHDPGTIGKGGLMEKDLVLDVALRLEKMVRAGAAGGGHPHPLLRRLHPPRGAHRHRQLARGRPLPLHPRQRQPQLRGPGASRPTS